MTVKKGKENGPFVIAFHAITMFIYASHFMDIRYVISAAVVTTITLCKDVAFKTCQNYK